MSSDAVWLSRSEVHALASWLQRCPGAQGRDGRPKVIWPTWKLAQAMADCFRPSTVYQCRGHWHVTSVRKRPGPYFRAARWAQLIADANDRAARYGRQRVRGVKTSTGNWVYQSRPVESQQCP